MDFTENNLGLETYVQRTNLKPDQLENQIEIDKSKNKNDDSNNMDLTEEL